ncbi:peptide deformylase [Anaerofustis stercorihominis]|uniref:Peptide deformylase n=3 Tax=Anaerofustis stercorihominis TaxID=214853 RepID=B1CBL1_9FIRM|nr:peptide deformylase [Anaerofustis stercorihominis]EDS71658.1 peptide deformylase [Anaerofustis stercorihominis DSM 17244]MCQ4796284.1 peptide deformylase [Anaerofustis stercorihominis]RGD75268.1 peptide deformylase [Anaerofustis stercorihominis]
MIKEILLLGNPNLYKVSKEVKEEEIQLLKNIEIDLHDTLMNYRKVHGAGRAIAAPQIGIEKRILYMNIDKPILIVNPKLTFPDSEKIQVMDDCMSFPNLTVKVERYKNCILNYKDRNFSDCKMILKDDLSELIQHEYDHLDGILATMRGIDSKSFYLK